MTLLFILDIHTVYNQIAKVTQRQVNSGGILGGWEEVTALKDLGASIFDGIKELVALSACLD